jgi:hypothetical protein
VTTHRRWPPKNELSRAVACFRDDFEACIAHLRLPIGHRRTIRSTNLLERLFVLKRRRLKIVPDASWTCLFQGSDERPPGLSWFQSGIRPNSVKDQRHSAVYLFGAVCPERAVELAE